MMPERKAALPPLPWKAERNEEGKIRISNVHGIVIEDCDGMPLAVVSPAHPTVAALLLRAPGVEAAARELIGAVDRLDYAGNPQQLLERLRLALGDAK